MMAPRASAPNRGEAAPKWLNARFFDWKGQNMPVFRQKNGRTVMSKVII
jgi:hypothetical protein